MQPEDSVPSLSPQAAPEEKRRLWQFVAASLAMVAVLSLPFLIKSRAFAFVDIGVDTFFCFYPLQVAVSEQLHQLGFFTWSFDLGLGGFLGSLFDPLWLITGWFPESWQLSLRLPMFGLRILLAGSFFYAYLRLVGFEAAISAIGGLGYSFSNYALINAQWEIMHGTEFVQLAAYLYLFERHLRSRESWTGVAAGVVVGLGHPLGLYMFALFSALYLGIKFSITARTQWFALARGVATYLGWFSLGLLITAPLLFPAVYYLLESPRVSGANALFSNLLHSIFSLNDRATLFSEISGLLGKDLLGSDLHYRGWSNYFEGPGFYVGLLPLICIPQLLGPSATQQERWRCVIGIVAITIYFVWPAVRYVVYGFGHISFRFSTLWVSVLILLLGLGGLRRAIVSGLWPLGLAVGFAGIFAIALFAEWLNPAAVEINYVIKVIAFAGLYCAALRIAALGNGASSTQLLLWICMCELLVFAIPAVVDRETVPIRGSEANRTYEDGSREAVRFAREYDHQRFHDDAFFRIDKTYQSVYLDDALVQGYSGTASYYFHAASITRFVDRLGLPRPDVTANYISSIAQAGRRDMLDLVGAKYVLASDRNLDQTRDMTFLSAVDRINVYRNNSARAFGHFYDAMASEGQADEVPVPQRDAFLLQHVVVADPAALNARITAAHSVPAQGLSQQTTIHKIRDDLLTGSVQTPNASTLLLSMPFDHGWTMRLDGQAIETLLADYGLTAAVIPAGKHEVELSYAPPGRTIGKWLSLGSLVMLCILLLRRRIMRAA